MENLGKMHMTIVDSRNGVLFSSRSDTEDIIVNELGLEPIKMEADDMVLRVNGFVHHCDGVSVNGLPKPKPVENVHGCPQALWKKIVSNGMGQIYNEAYEALAENDMWYSHNKGIAITLDKKKEQAELLKVMAHNSAVTIVSAKFRKNAKNTKGEK